MEFKGASNGEFEIAMALLLAKGTSGALCEVKLSGCFYCVTV